MTRDRFAGMLGLAVKAGKTVFGAEACDAGIKNGKTKLVIVDGSASERTRKDFRNACDYYAVRMIQLAEEDFLQTCLGRTGSKLMGITDDGFAKKVEELYVVYSGGEKT